MVVVLLIFSILILLLEFEELLFESQQAYADSDHEIHKLMKTVKNAFKKSNNSKKHINAPQRLKEVIARFLILSNISNLNNPVFN